MKFHLIAAATLLAGGTAALAQEQDSRAQEQAAATAPAASQNEAEQAEDEQDPGEEIQCRTERVTGSLTRRRRTCLTRNEWAAIEAGTRDGLNEMGRGASGGVACTQDQFGGC